MKAEVGTETLNVTQKPEPKVVGQVHDQIRPDAQGLIVQTEGKTMGRLAATKTAPITAPNN